MVVEFLTFEVEPADHSAWLEVEEAVWSRYLEAQPGFVRKEVWRGTEGNLRTHAVIWWENRESWKAITTDRVAAVDARMGSWYRGSTCLEFEVLRDR